MGKTWMFTLNNYTEEQAAWCTAYSTEPNIVRMTVSKEVGETGTPHLQGCITWKSNKRLAGCNKLLKAHWTKADSPDAAHEYPVKSDSDVFVQVNNKNKGQGKRVDIPEMAAAIRAADNWNQVLDIPGVNRHFAWAKAVWAAKPQPGESIEDFRPWQHKLYLELLEEPDKRKIIWYYDETGGSGKTTMGIHMISMGAYYCCNGKSSDIVFAYQNQKIIVFDLARSSETVTNYMVIEKLKDGVMFSAKYESQTKYRKGGAHMVVFSNFLPDKSQMSADRWDIRVL